MAVRVQIGGRDLADATEYSVVEDSTPVDPSDETGGTAQLDVTVPEWPGWRAIRHQQLGFRDSTQGTTQGEVQAIALSRGLVKLSAASRILSLAVERIAQPYVGTLDGAIRYYLSLVGVTDNLVIEEGLDLIPVVFPGWKADVYQQLARKLCPAWSLEMSLVSNNIVFRSFRGRKAVLQRATQLDVAIDDGSRSQNVRMTWYDTENFQQKLVYPPGGWNEDVEVFDVNAGETKVIEELELDSSVSDINQPVCVDRIGPGYQSSSVYTVSGNDGLPIPPAMWQKFGGDLKVSINEDTRTLRLEITGMGFEAYAPYTIGIASGPSNYYSTLRIVGNGVRLNPHVREMGTGLTQDDTTQEFGDDVDNEFINGDGQAYDVSSWQIASGRGPAQTLSFAAAGINRTIDNGSFAYATVADFDKLYAGKTVAQFDAEWSGKDGYDWQDFWDAKVSEDFRNQAFGNVAGARIFFGDAIYRIRSATNARGALSGTAQMDCTVADWDDYYEGMTVADFDAMWADKTVEEFDLGPFPGIR